MMPNRLTLGFLLLCPLPLLLNCAQPFKTAAPEMSVTKSERSKKTPVFAVKSKPWHRSTLKTETKSIIPEQKISLREILLKKQPDSTAQEGSNLTEATHRSSFSQLMTRLRKGFRSATSDPSPDADDLPRLNNETEEPDSSPVVNEEDRIRAGAFASLLMGESSLTDRMSKMRELLENPDPAARNALLMIFPNPKDPLAPFALSLLIRLGKGEDPKIERLVKDALDDKRPEVRKIAVLATTEDGGRQAATLILKRFRLEEDTDVKIALVLSIGHLALKQAHSVLLESINEGPPPLRFAVAWALWKLNDPRGVEYLESIASSDDRSLTPQAMEVLAEMNSLSSLPVFIRALDSRWQPCWKAAAHALQSFQGDGAGLTLIHSLNETDISPSFKRRMLFVLIGRSPQDEEAAQWLTQTLTPSSEALAESLRLPVDLSELSYLLEVAIKTPHPVIMEAALLLLSHNEPAVGLQAAQALTAIAKLLKKDSDIPQDSESQLWRIWWIRNSRAEKFENTSGKDAPLQLIGPEGVSRTVISGQRLPSGLFIESVTSEETTGERYLVMEYHGRRYRIQTKPVSEQRNSSSPGDQSAPD